MLGLLLGCACRPSGLTGESADAILAMLAREGQVVDASLGGGSVRYLGYTVSPPLASPGSVLDITHYWACGRALDRDYQVFVHFLLDGASGWLPNGDHVPRPRVADWRPGDVIAVKEGVRLPSYLPGEQIELRLGFFEGKTRLPVDDARRDDGTGRLRAGRVPVAGTPIPKPTYAVHLLTRPPRIDGVVDDDVWTGLPAVAGFTKSRGDGPARVATKVVAGWKDANLYVAFTTPDPDIQARLTHHDDPIYREETVEMFIETETPGTYVELQSNPRGVTFDAAFRGGARRNMNVAYDADFEAACTTQGSIDDPRDTDQGWQCEWRIGLQSIPGLSLPIDPSSTRWRVNFFRVAKDDREAPDESAWSPPLMGDFHNLDRFGTLVFRAPLGDVEGNR